MTQHTQDEFVCGDAAEARTRTGRATKADLEDQQRQRLQAAAYGLPDGSPVPEPVDPLRLDRNAAQRGLTRQEYITRLLAGAYLDPPVAPPLTHRILAAVNWVGFFVILGLPVINAVVLALYHYHLDDWPPIALIVVVAGGVIVTASWVAMVLD